MTIRLLAFALAVTVIPTAVDGKPLLCPLANDEISKRSTVIGEWKPVYERYLKEVHLTYRL